MTGKSCKHTSFFSFLLLSLVLLGGPANAANRTSTGNARELAAVRAVLKIAQGGIDMPSEVSSSLHVKLPEFEVNKSDGVEYRTTSSNNPSPDISYITYAFLAPNTPNQRISLEYNLVSRNLCVRLSTLRAHLPKLRSIIEPDPFGPSYGFDIVGEMMSSVVIQFSGTSHCVDSISIVQTLGVTK